MFPLPAADGGADLLVAAGGGVVCYDRNGTRRWRSRSCGINAIAGGATFFTFPAMMSHLGGGLTYSLYGVVNIVVAVALWRFMPETSGRSLEELEEHLEVLYTKPGDKVLDLV